VSFNLRLCRVGSSSCYGCGPPQEAQEFYNMRCGEVDKQPQKFRREALLSSCSAVAGRTGKGIGF